MLATVALSLPLFLRSIDNLSRGLDSDIEEFVQHNADAVNILTLLFMDLTPTLFQFFTLIFGYIRNKQEQKGQNIHVISAELSEESVNWYSESNSLKSSVISSPNYFEPPLMDESSHSTSSKMPSRASGRSTNPNLGRLNIHERQSLKEKQSSNTFKQLKKQ